MGGPRGQSPLGGRVASTLPDERRSCGAEIGRSRFSVATGGYRLRRKSFTVVDDDFQLSVASHKTERLIPLDRMFVLSGGSKNRHTRV